MNPRRPSERQTLMSVAHVIAWRATCPYASVGALLVRDGRILATGYNGAAANAPHCTHDDSPTRTLGSFGDSYTVPREACTTAIHAETNAIAYAARYGLSTRGADLFVTVSPCAKCTDLIIASGVGRVFYDQPYRNTDGIDRLVSMGLTVRQQGPWPE